MTAYHHQTQLNIRDEIDIAITRAVLAAIDAADPATVSYAVRVLRKEDGKNPLSGALAFLPAAKVRRLVGHVLESATLAERVGPTIRLTAEGNHFLRGFLPAPQGIIAGGILSMECSCSAGSPTCRACALEGRGAKAAKTAQPYEAGVWEQPLGFVSWSQHSSAELAMKAARRYSRAQTAKTGGALSWSGGWRKIGDRRVNWVEV